MKSFWIVLIGFFLFTSSAKAQPKDYGDISAEDFLAYDSTYNESASAVILFEKGVVEFDSDYNCILQLHRRIKILTDQGADYGDIEIPAYKPARQNVSSIKAVTYILNEDGEIEEKKINEEDIFTSVEGHVIEVKKFTMPDLQPGVIIEYYYRKKMGNAFMMPDWEFHGYIPIEWSEIEMIVPSTLNYRMVFKGGDTLHINEAERINNLVNNMPAQSIRLAKKDLKPIESLPFLLNRDDHVSSVITQLTGMSIPGYYPRNFPRSWDEIIKQLNEREDFGKQKANRAIKGLVNSIITDGMNDLEKVEAVYSYMVNNFEWDGYHYLVTEKGIRDTFDDKMGNSADLNLLLTIMLREAGIGTNPALISTRDNGSVLGDYPSLNQFNMLVVAVESEEGVFMLDASSGLRSYTFPHPKLLFRNALVIRKDNTFGWLLTHSLENSSERLSMNYSLKDSSKIAVSISARTKGAFSEQLRSDVDRLDFNSYWEDYYSDLEDVTVDSSSFTNLQNLGESVTYKTSFSMEKEERLKLGNEFIYLNPFLFLSEPENPFIKTERNLPIEFPFPYGKQHLVRVTLPDGYIVDEIPESVEVNLPDQGGYYRFQTNLTGDVLTLVSITSINTYYYAPDQYQEIKELFEAKYKATNSQVVLKKESSE
ncbi:MAG: DUF3857 domain-containing protein [Balneola sp.]|nr:MAG: DUF3857 domain-containing protein [Balneola sp.]